LDNSKYKPKAKKEVILPNHVFRPTVLPEPTNKLHVRYPLRPQDAQASLLYLNSNNSNENPRKEVLSVAKRRSAAALTMNVQYFVETVGLANVGMLTLTFPRKVLIPKDAQRMFNSMRTAFLSKHFGEYIRVFERQKSGSIHYHLLIDTRTDIRTGLDFEAIAKRDYKSASPQLRSIWKLLRDNLPAYGFGRSELLPIKTTPEAMGKYVGKYIGKGHESRMWQDKGVRLVDYSKSARMATSNFQFVSEGSAQWRLKVAAFATELGNCLGERVTYSDLKPLLGDRWAYNSRDYIISIDAESNHLRLPPTDRPTPRPEAARLHRPDHE
jgi:hypothetical protein